MVDSSLLGTADSEAVSPCPNISYSMVIISRFLAFSVFIASGVDYANLDHGSYLHFATIGTNNGHNGNFDAAPFLMPSRNETVTDFAYRAIHVAAQVGKNLTSIYYGSAPHHSYYDGCSAGGRQGISAASRYPEDFDGIIAGSPAVDWNYLLGSSGIWASHVAFKSPSYIPANLWNTTVTQEVLKQCDALDGRVDGIIANPNVCQWDPTALLCTDKDVTNPSGCLIQPQVDGLKEFYKPILDTDGKLIYARFDPGAEGDMSYGFGMSGTLSPLTEVWNAIHYAQNKLFLSHDLTNFI
jgi:feruloyl esterase